MTRPFYTYTCLLFSFSFFLSSLWSQGYSYIRYTTEDGLPTNYVYGVVEDEEGYIWAYTENGLARFDGYEWRHFTTEEGLPANDIVYAAKAVDGKIWLHSYRNAPAYLYQDSIYVVGEGSCKLLNILYDGTPYYGCYFLNTYIFDGNIQKVYSHVLSQWELDYLSSDIKKTGSIPYSQATLNTLSRAYGQFYSIQEDSILIWQLKSYITGTLLNDRSFLWATQKAIAWKDHNQKVQEIIVNANQGLRIVNAYISRQWSVPSDSNLYVFQLGKDHNHQYAIFDKAGATLTPFQSKDFGLYPRLHSSINMQQEAFWLYTDVGSVQFSHSGKILRQINWNQDEQKWVMLRPYTDSRGNIWQGTRNSGLLMIPYTYQKCRQLVPEEEPKHYERILQTTRGTILAFTADGATYTWHKKEGLKLFGAAPGNARFRTATTHANEVLISNSNASVHLTDKGEYLKIMPLTLKEKGFVPSYCYAKFVNNLTSLLNYTAISYHAGQKKWIMVNGSGVIYTAQWNEIQARWDISLKCKEAKLVYYDSWQSQLWGVSSDEIVAIEEENGELQYAPLMAKDSCPPNISALYSTSGKLWIGTEKSGLYYYDFAKEKLVFVTEADQIRAIRPDGKNGIALATNEGVLLLNTDTPEQLHGYTSKDGLPTNEIEDVLALGDSILLIASAEGIHQIDRKWPTAPFLPKQALQLTAIEVDSTTVTSAQLVSLPHTIRQLNFNFSLRAYASNQDITYQTKLEPLESSWVHSNERQRRYPSLSPGSYTFHLQAIDRFGQIVRHTPVQVRIHPAFWQTLWFKLIVTFACIGLLIGISSWRIRKNYQQLSKEKALSRRLSQLELDALKSQMNPHFIFNALGAIQFYIQTHETKLADEYLTQFADLMRKYLDSSRETFISLEQELDLLENYIALEEMRFEKLFRVKINYDCKMDTANHYLPAMIIQPFVENAINHGLGERRDGAGILRIHFTSPGTQMLTCVIEDNGIGRINAQKKKRSGHRSSGMKIVAEKIETLLAAKLVDVSINTTDANTGDKIYPGTRVVIHIKTISDDET